MPASDRLVAPVSFEQLLASIPNLQPARPARFHDVGDAGMLGVNEEGSVAYSSFLPQLPAISSLVLQPLLVNFACPKPDLVLQFFRSIWLLRFRFFD
jgi:hypothetical protein